MRYLKVYWIHQIPAEPVLMISELDDNRYEARKIEIFSDGRMSIASRNHQSDCTMLSEAPVPDVSIVSLDPQFSVHVIDREAFENAWRAATSGQCWTFVD